MGNWQTINVNGVIPADPIVSEGDGTTLIANTDLVNPIYLSDDAGMYANQQNSIVLNPQSTMVVDGKTNLYAIANPGKIVAVNVVPGGMSFFQSTILGTNFLVTNAGFFFYSGTPGVGNLIASIVSPGTTKDPYGNSVAAVFEAGSIGSNYMQIDASGDLILYNTGRLVWMFSPTKQAMFVYSPSRAAGNLVQSIAQSPGTDSVGNAYLAGTVTYDSSLISAVQIVGSSINFYSAASEAGPWNQLGSIGDGTWQEPTGLNLGVGALPANIQMTAALVDIISNLQVDNGVLIQASKGGLGGLLKVVNQLAAPGNVPILLEAQSATDRFIGIDVVGDTVRRFNLNAGGSMLWGPGNTSQDSTLFRASANLLASDYLAFAASNTAAETWHAFTFVNGWAQAIGPTCSYRRVAAPDNCVQVVCALSVPSGVVAGQNITGAMPTGYRPVSTQWVNATNGTGPKSCVITVTTGGQLQFQSGAVAGDEIIIPAGNLVALTV